MLLGDHQVPLGLLIGGVAVAVYRLGAAVKEDGDSLAVGAFLDHKHLVHGGANSHLPGDPARAEFLVAQLLEPEQDAAGGGGVLSLSKTSIKMLQLI